MTRDLIYFLLYELCYFRYAGLLENVKSTYGVDSFKFDAGEINYVTAVPDFQTFTDLQNVGVYTQKYAECAFSRQVRHKKSL